MCVIVDYEVNYIHYSPIGSSGTKSHYQKITVVHSEIQSLEGKFILGFDNGGTSNWD